MGVMDPAALCVVGSSMPRNIDGSTFPMQSIYLILVFLHIILWVHGGVWKLRCVGVVDPAALCVVGSGMPRNIDGSTLPMQCYNSDFSCLFITITSPPPGLGGGGVETSVYGGGGSCCTLCGGIQHAQEHRWIHIPHAMLHYKYWLDFLHKLCIL
jgi:hypothetical protein